MQGGECMGEIYDMILGKSILFWFCSVEIYLGCLSMYIYFFDLILHIKSNQIKKKKKKKKKNERYY